MSHCILEIIPDNRTIRTPRHTPLHEALDRHGIDITAYCDGAGLCGKCVVLIQPEEGYELPVTAADERHISAEELSLGYRLACQWRVCCDAKITIPAKTRAGSIHILTESREEETDVTAVVNPDAPYGIAVDIGSTTVVASLLDMRTGATIAVSSDINGQHVYGADVVSRINHSLNDGGLEELHTVLEETLNTVMQNTLDEADISPEKVAKIILTGNSVMLHSFHKESMETLSVIPFEPTFKDARTVLAGNVCTCFPETTEAWTFPLIGGFVGGDTVSCMLAIDMDTTETCQLMIDIGTNGEVALACNGKLITTSAPAGPAFEGALISAGMRGTVGAIEHVRITEDTMIVEVIGQCPPRGICGTGCIDAIATLLDWGVLDMTGRLNDKEDIHRTTPQWVKDRVCVKNEQPAFCIFDPATDEYFENGDPPDAIYLTQKDIRELQLAKGAIATAYVLLMQQLDISHDDIECVSLAGAFGNYMRPRNARRIGLLPDIPLSRIHFIGNAASTGAKYALLTKDGTARAKKIAQNSKHIELAEDPGFHMAYAEQMMFPERIASD